MHCFKPYKHLQTNDHKTSAQTSAAILQTSAEVIIYVFTFTKEGCAFQYKVVCLYFCVHVSVCIYVCMYTCK